MGRTSKFSCLLVRPTFFLISFETRQIKKTVALSTVNSRFLFITDWSGESSVCALLCHAKIKRLDVKTSRNVTKGFVYRLHFHSPPVAEFTRLGLRVLFLNSRPLSLESRFNSNEIALSQFISFFNFAFSIKIAGKA